MPLQNHFLNEFFGIKMTVILFFEGSSTYPTGPQREGLLLRFRLEETGGTVGGTGTEEGTDAWAGGAPTTGTGGILNGDELLIGV